MSISNDFEPGDIKDVSALGGERATVDALNQDRAALRSLGAEVAAGKRTAAEMQLAATRRSADFEDKFSKLQASVRSEWTPGGDDAVILRKYATEDGGIRLNDASTTIRLPNGKTTDIKARGYLTDPFPATRAQETIQDHYRAFAMAYRIAEFSGGRGVDPHNHPMVQRMFLDLYRAIESQPGEVGRRLSAVLSRAMSGAAGAGYEFVAAPQVAGLIRPYDLDTAFVARIRRQEAPADVFTRPIVSGEVIFYAAGRVTNDDPTQFQTSSVTTSSRSTTIKNFAGHMILDQFLMTDVARSRLVDPGEWQYQIRRGFMRTLENTLINGNTAGTQDTLSTWNFDSIYTAGALSGATTPIKLMEGFRRRAFERSAANDCGQVFSVDVAFASLSRMGVHANSPDLAWLTSIHALHTQILPDPNFLTVDKIGSDLATIRSGRLGSLLGKPVDVSSFVTNDLSVSTGKYTGTGASTSLMLIDYGAFVLYALDGDMAEFEVTEPQKNAVHIGATARLALDTIAPAADVVVSLDYDL